MKLLVSLKEAVNKVSSTIILFESPHRLLKTFGDIEQVFGDITLVVSREISKIHEEAKRGKISQLKELYLQRKIKGEIVILFNLKES